MLGVMNQPLPNLGALGGLSRHHLFTQDWQPTPPAGALGQQQGSVDLNLLGLGGASMRPMAALQEGALRLPQDSHQHLQQQQAQLWGRDDVLQPQLRRAGATREPSTAAAADTNSWLMKMFGKADAAADVAAPTHPALSRFETPASAALLPPSGGSGSAPQQQTPFPTLQPRAPQSQQMQAAPFGSLTPYLQHPGAQQQPHQQQSGPGHLPPPPHAAANTLRGDPGQKQQQELWRKGLFSEVFDPPTRGDSPFHIPDLTDIEAPDVEDLLMTNLGGLGEGLDSFQLPGNSPTCMPSPAPAFQLQPAVALTHHLHQAQQQGAGGPTGLLASQSPAPGGLSNPFGIPQALESPGGEEGSGLLPLLSPNLQQQQPAGGGSQWVQQAQQGAARAGVPLPTVDRKSSKKVPSKKAAAAGRKRAAAAAAVAAAKHMRQARGEPVAVVEWYTEEDPDTPLEGLDPPARPLRDMSTLRLSPAAALVAAAVSDADAHPPCAAEGTKAESDGALLDGPLGGVRAPSRASQAPGVPLSRETRDDSAGSADVAPGQALAGAAVGACGSRVLGWLFGAACPQRWLCGECRGVPRCDAMAEGSC